jgi:Uma2 family endonuclease
MSLAYKYNPRYTVADYQRWEGDWELIDGIPDSMSPSASGEHQQIGMRLANMIFNQLSQTGCSDCQVFYELDWIVDEHTVLRPDLLVVCGEPVQNHLTRPPVLARVGPCWRLRSCPTQPAKKIAL